MGVTNLPFSTADILLPRACDLTKWSVVACDQYSSEPEYWDRVAANVGDAPSTLHMILPEAQLKAPNSRIAAINATMRTYWETGLFRVLPNALVYLERTMSNGTIRRGLVGKVDLEAYDYTPGSGSAIRATEGTVQERIPPRARVRRDALLELPHVLLLMDDPQDAVLGPVTAKRAELESLYDFDLMEQGGHIAGWLVNGENANALLARLADLQTASPMLFAVGDGNHSLATAKACYEELKAAHPDRDFSNHPARYALVEVENIHDDALQFEPIHRVVFGVDPAALLAELNASVSAQGGYAVPYVTAAGEGTVYLDRSGSHLAVGALQNFLDGYLKTHDGQIDYIHGDDVARRLAEAPDTIAFLLPPMEKADLFPSVIGDGVLPRKTFSMGHAHEKRFYLEGRLIRDDA
jgi:uncharacterized protein (DUF1015 family)